LTGKRWLERSWRWRVNVSTARHLSKSYIQTSSAVPELANYASLCERTGQRVLHAERQGSGAHSVVHGRGSCIPVFCGRAGSALFSFSAPVSAGIPWLMLGAQARGPSSAELETKRLLSADRGAGRQWGQLAAAIPGRRPHVVAFSGRVLHLFVRPPAERLCCQLSSRLGRVGCIENASSGVQTYPVDINAPEADLL
jgi:hypothetical protein